MKSLLEKAFLEEDFQVTDRQAEQFSKYAELLIEWNQKMNLTAIENEEDIVYKHFLDSVLTERTMSKEGYSLIDVGTGAGFPGIPLKIMNEDIKLCLFDSLQKRVGFLRHVADEIGLDQVECIHGRAEEFGQKAEYREQFDFATARAVAKLPLLLELCLPFVKVGGKFIALKGPDGELEIEESKKALNELGGKVVEIHQFEICDGQYKRCLVVVEKTKPTPKKYPRKAGTPQKKPL